MAARGDGRLSRMSQCSTSSTTSCIDRLIHLTTCGHCKQQLKDARILPCHHSFCYNCLVEIISSSNSKDEFICPQDRRVIKIPSFGVGSFDRDPYSQELEEIVYELEDTLLDESNSCSADLDISLESLSKGVKDIEHSSAMAQHQVNTAFNELNKTLRVKQEELIRDIKRKSQRQVLNLEFEKYRLIETKKFQNEQFCDSSFYEEDLAVPLTTNKSITASSPPSLNSGFSYRDFSTSLDKKMSLLSCHIGQQHLEFSPNKETLQKLYQGFDYIGSVTCDFDLKVNLERNLLALDEYPFGMKIAGDCINVLDWTPLNPKGLSKCIASKVVVGNSGKNELIILDSSYTMKHIIQGGSKFSSVGDVTTCGNNIFVVDEFNSQIVMLDCEGNVVRKVGKLGNGSLEFKRPSGITADSVGRIIVSDSLNHRIKVLSPDLQKCLLTLTSDKKKFKTATKFSYPCGVATDNQDNIYVTDTNRKRVVQLTKEGKFMKEIIPSDYHDPRCIAVSADFNILLTDRDNGKLLVCDNLGSHMSCISGIMDNMGTLTKFKQPYGVVVDGTDKIIMTDCELNAVFVF